MFSSYWGGRADAAGFTPWALPAGALQALASDGDGGVLVATSDSDGLVTLSRLDGDGATAWTRPAVPPEGCCQPAPIVTGIAGVAEGRALVTGYVHEELSLGAGPLGAGSGSISDAFGTSSLVAVRVFLLELDLAGGATLRSEVVGCGDAASIDPAISSPWLLASNPALPEAVALGGASRLRALGGVERASELDAFVARLPGQAR